MHQESPKLTLSTGKKDFPLIYWLWEFEFSFPRSVWRRALGQLILAFFKISLCRCLESVSALWCFKWAPKEQNDIFPPTHLSSAQNILDSKGMVNNDEWALCWKKPPSKWRWQEIICSGSSRPRVQTFPGLWVRNHSAVFNMWITLHYSGKREAIFESPK